MPVRVNKSTVTQHAIDILEEEGKLIDTVITVDDNYNGLFMLMPKVYGGKDNRRIPNYPIVMGKTLDKHEILHQHPRVIQAKENGQLALAIHQQVEKIKQNHSHNSRLALLA